jgi:hypothetical protein
MDRKPFSRRSRKQARTELEELVRLLNGADPTLIPVLTVGGVAGLRRTEIQRLDWAVVPGLKVDHNLTVS